jgi:hypothetical protein
MKQEKDRTKEIEEFFLTMQEKTGKYQKYFAALATLPQEPRKPRTQVEYANSSVPRGEIKDARLESNLRRNSES